MAQALNLKIIEHGVNTFTNTYQFSGTWENGWIKEKYPAKGLFVASAWFESDTAIEYTFSLTKPGILIFCIDTGDITIRENGGIERKLNSYTEVISFADSMSSMSIFIPEKEHVCFTSVMIYDDCIAEFLKANHFDYPILAKNSQNWRQPHIDTQAAMLIMEQIRWGGGEIEFLKLLFYVKQ